MYIQYGVVNRHFLGYVGAFSGTPSFLSNVKILPDTLILQLIDQINICFVYWICEDHFSQGYIKPEYQCQISAVQVHQL